MFEKIKEFFRRNKFKKGDKVYVNKRGEFDYGRDWTLHHITRLEKNKVYTIESVKMDYIKLNIYNSQNHTFNYHGFYYHYKHFKKYV